MATAPSMKELLAPTTDAMSKTLQQRIAEAQAKGDKKEVERLNFAAGIQSAATGLVTGIPDLGVLGYNFATARNVKDLRTRVLEASGVPTAATDTENELTYNLPEYAVMAWGLSSLAKSGWKGFRDVRQSKKMAEFAKTLPPQQANRFSKFMLNGQGSNDPMVQAALAQLRKDPRYAELFTTLDKAATETAIKAMAPRASAVSKPTAVKDAVKTVEKNIDALKKARDTAGDASFLKAQNLAGDRGIVNTSNTVNTIDNLISRYARADTPSARRTVESLQQLKNTFLQTTAQPAVGSPLTTPKNMNVGQFQALLSEFGKKIGTDDSIVKGLAQSDLETINKAIFASLHTDLKSSLKAAGSVEDKRALAALITAREQFKTGSETYNKVIAQGIPKMLQNKSIDEISFDDLSKAYKKLDPSNRALFRSWVGSAKPESLQALDKTVFDEFLAKSYKPLPDGTMGHDLKTLAENWKTLRQTNPDKADMLVQALGTNAAEFTDRMNDALVFTRKLDTGGQFPDAATTGMLERLKRATVGVVGSTSAGYQGAKATDLSFQIAQQLANKSGLTSEQLMKVLLTPEAATFLKQAALSPSSTKTLEALTKLNTVTTPAKAWLATGGVVTGMGERAPQEGFIPDDLMGGEDVFIPDDLMMQEGAPEDDVFIPDDLLMDNEANMGMDTTSPESRLRSQVGPGGVLDRGGIDQWRVDTMMQDPALASNREAQSIVRQLGLLQ
jgi:hypothetical protein